MNQTDHYQNEFSANWAGLPGYKSSWVDHLRLKAINRFTSEGFPHPRAEDWKYTNLEGIITSPFTVQSPTPESQKVEGIQAMLDEIDSIADLVFINGCFSSRYSRHDLKGSGKLATIASELNNGSSTLKSTLTKGEAESSTFDSLNTAFMNDGVYLVIHKNIQLEKPIQILSIVTDSSQSLNLNSRNVLVFEKDSQATIIQRVVTVGSNQQTFNNIINEITLHENASVSHYQIQNEGQQSYHIANNRVHQLKDSHYRYRLFALGALLSRQEVKIKLEAEGARSEIDALLMLDEERQADFYTDVEHQVPNCSSTEKVHGVLAGKSKGVFRGKIVVREQAQKTDARLHNANLLLSPDAEINAMPQLEIFADDVKCSHGSSSGQLDPDQLFFLKSRGLSDKAAHSLLVYAFANAIIEKQEAGPIRRFLKSLVLSKLPENSEIKELIL